MLPVDSAEGARRSAPWVLLFAYALLALGLVGCGVPLSQADVLATAEAEPTLALETRLLPEAQVQAAAQEAGTLALPASQAHGGATPAPGITPSTTPTPRPSASVTAATATPTPTPGTAIAVAATGGANAAQSAEAVRLVNELRAGRGLKVLTISGTLTASANAFAKLMAESNQFGHLGPDGSTPQGRVTAGGYRGAFRGEALAAGQSNASTVVDTWRDSAAHLAILTDTAATEVGIGYFLDPGDTYSHYWVFVVGAP